MTIQYLTRNGAHDLLAPRLAARPDLLAAVLLDGASFTDRTGKTYRVSTEPELPSAPAPIATRAAPATPAAPPAAPPARRAPPRDELLEVAMKAADEVRDPYLERASAELRARIGLPATLSGQPRHTDASDDPLLDKAMRAAAEVDGPRDPLVDQLLRESGVLPAKVQP